MKIFFGIAIFGLVSCRVVPITSDKYLKPEIETYELSSADTLVDIGCDDGTHSAYISHYFPHLYFILEDIHTDLSARLEINFKRSSFLSMYIKDRYRAAVGTFDSIPLNSSTYQNLLCRKTLHEFEEPGKMIDEMNRILKRAGKIIIVEAKPYKKGEKDPYCGKPYLSDKEVIEMLRKGGFTLIKSSEIPMKRMKKLMVFHFEKA